MHTDHQFWEKTIEYAFVIAAAKGKKLDLAMPLAGKPERAAGDAIFGRDARLVLVEFKRGRHQVDSEYSLFDDYQSAREQLAEMDNHHHLVFPESVGDVDSRLTLHAETYFSSRVRANAIECLSCNTDPTTFRQYLAKLFSLKKSDGRSSGGQLGVIELASVLGVSTDGKLVEAVTLKDFAPSLFPELDLQSHAPTEVHRATSRPK